MDRHISSDAVKAILSNYGLPYHVYPKMWDEINALPSAEEESFEWCTDCKEYDQEKHCCHRFTKVIRQAFEEMKVVHCIDCRHSEYDEIYKDRYCHYNGKAEVVHHYHFCRDGEKRDDDVTCDNCDYSEKRVWENDWRGEWMN